MKKFSKKFKVRLLSIITAMIMALSGVVTAYAAGVETLYPGITEMGSFAFNDTNITPSKTVQGSKVTINVSWRKADGLYGSINGDQGIGDVKLTMQIRDTAGNALTDKYVFYYDETATNGYVNDQISLNVTPGQKIKIWMDASSVNPAESNGRYRTIYFRNFWAVVTE